MMQQGTKTQMGIAAAKAGQRESARELLVEALQENDQDINAWLWLSSVVETDQDRLDCIEQVLRLDPKHPSALKAQSLLRSRIEESTHLTPVITQAAPESAQAAPDEITQAAPENAQAAPESTQAAFVVASPVVDESAFPGVEDVEKVEEEAPVESISTTIEKSPFVSQPFSVGESAYQEAADAKPAFMESLTEAANFDQANQSRQNIPIPTASSIPPLTDSTTLSGKKKIKGPPQARHVGPFTILPPELANEPEYQQETIIVLGPLAVALLIILGILLLVMVVLAGSLLIFQPQTFWQNLADFFGGIGKIFQGK